jgi:hypothetical protein
LSRPIVAPNQAEWAAGRETPTTRAQSTGEGHPGLG